MMETVYEFVGLPAWKFWIVVVMLISGCVAQPGAATMQPHTHGGSDSDHED
jgi:hypothetical protein